MYEEDTMIHDDELDEVLNMGDEEMEDEEIDDSEGDADDEE